jgi:hypothetical protein
MINEWCACPFMSRFIKITGGSNLSSIWQFITSQRFVVSGDVLKLICFLNKQVKSSF